MWTTQHDAAFQALKDELCENVLLEYPNMDYSFHIIIDSSILSTAAPFYQEYDGERHIIGFAGIILKPAESRYSVTEIESLSLIHAVRKWKSLFQCHQVIVQTEHSALVHLRTISTLDCTGGI